MGRCPGCGSWNSFTETKSRRVVAEGSSVPLDVVETKSAARLDTGNQELNRVLGGGFMRGSSVLIGGEPGIGKSTFMLQLASSVRTEGRVLYVSGEESAAQIRMRADRLQLVLNKIEVLSETGLDVILNVVDKVRPALVIIDSVQTIYKEEASAVPGTVSQLKHCTQELTTHIKKSGACLFLVGHVTKEGVIAGPKVIEHMVDTVLYFDLAEMGIRLLRPSKNRFGSTEEIGIFQMNEKGLVSVRDPALLFLEHRQGDLPSGVAVAPVFEGSRILFVEIQSLVVSAKGGGSRVFSDKIDSRRVSRIAAVLESHLNLQLSAFDIYVNVAGGFKIEEVAVDLALAISLYSAKTNLSLPAHFAVLGEVSLAGEIRMVPHIDARLKASHEVGFKRIIGPNKTDGRKFPFYEQVATLKDAMRRAFADGQ